ncbi:hypothetical protein GJ496_007552 [Pomphorhynchus laevis]|nr:hypothetical protein GJ496_007552 [Pomphorhynchus laevis]
MNWGYPLLEKDLGQCNDLQPRFNIATISSLNSYTSQFLSEETTEHSEVEFPDNETINRMIAPSEEVYELSQAIDVDRYEKEESGSTRLLQEFELPHCLINNDTDGEKTPNNSINALGSDDLSMPIANAGRGALVRKVDYMDSINKREWLNTIKKEVARITNIRNGCERRGSKDDVAAKLTSRTP